MMNAVPLSCEASVAPLDSSPIRSPQAAHTSLLDHFRGKNIAEIGTRAATAWCYSQVARSALAIELRPDYCTMLEQRSRNATKHGSRGFEVLCKKFEDAKRIDASIITWWQGPPMLNVGTLCSLRKMQKQGKLPVNAEAVLLFDMKVCSDARDHERLQERGLFKWTRSIPFDERAGCRKSGFPDCSRARGTFVAGGIHLGDTKLGELCKLVDKVECESGGQRLCRMVLPQGKPNNCEVYEERYRLNYESKEERAERLKQPASKPAAEQYSPMQRKILARAAAASSKAADGSSSSSSCADPSACACGRASLQHGNSQGVRIAFGLYGLLSRTGGNFTSSYIERNVLRKLKPHGCVDTFIVATTGEPKSVLRSAEHHKSAVQRDWARFKPCDISIIDQGVIRRSGRVMPPFGRDTWNDNFASVNNHLMELYSVRELTYAIRDREGCARSRYTHAVVARIDTIVTSPIHWRLPSPPASLSSSSDAPPRKNGKNGGNGLSKNGLSKNGGGSSVQLDRL